MKMTIADNIKIAIVVITATLAFGSAFQKIEANAENLKSLHVYYKDVSTSLNSIAKDVANINGKVELIIKKVY